MSGCGASVYRKYIGPPNADVANRENERSIQYPGKRLVVYRNPEVAKVCARKRKALLNATAEKLEDVRSIVESGKLRGKDRIARGLDNIFF